jgi:preprotein translocase subunit SecG
MTALLMIIHILICVFLIISILLQSSKGGGLAGMFGGGGGGMGGVFGGRGAASFLSKVTLWLGVGFALTSISSALLSAKSTSRQRSMIEQVMEREGVSTPATMLPAVPGTTEEAPPQEVPQQEEKKNPDEEK